MRHILRLATVVGVAILIAASSAGASNQKALHWTAASLRSVALPVTFTPSPRSLLTQCRRTAQAVGYPVPCPLMIPQGLERTPVVGGPCPRYVFHVVGVPCSASTAWTGWVVGSTQIGSGGAGFQHLVIQASPKLTGYGKAVNGPVALPAAYERPLVGGSIVIHDWHTRWLFVDPAHDPGSSFMDHVVLCWTTGGHTYAVGFHAVTSELTAAAMDYKLMLHVELVRP